MRKAPGLALVGGWRLGTTGNAGSTQTRRRGCEEAEALVASGFREMESRNRQMKTFLAWPDLKWLQSASGSAFRTLTFLEELLMRRAFLHG